MNHVLQYTQLKFKFDPLMKPEILGSIPSGVANLWTLHRSTDRYDSQIKTNIVDLEKKCFLSFRKSIPMREGFRLESPLTFYFLLFLKWEKLSKNKTPQ